MIETIADAFGTYFGPVARIFDQAAQSVGGDPGQMAVGLAVAAVVFRLVTGYYVTYMAFGISDRILNLTNEIRVVVSGVAYALALFLLGRWPTTLFDEVKSKAEVVGSIYTKSFPGTKVELADYVWQLGNINPRWMFAAEVLLVAFVVDFLVFKKKGEALDEERSLILLLFTVLLGVGAYFLAPVLFPTTVMVGFTAKAVETLAGLYIFTWVVAFAAVGFMRLLKAGPSPVFPVRETVDMPSRDKRLFATFFVGGIFATETLMWALIKIGGVMAYLAGGGWKVVYILSGGVRYEQQHCEQVENPDGTVEEVCRTVTNWDLPWKGEQE